jgi:prepilin-type N-terminal cleavage/methylation domain-containing protein
MAGDTQIFPSAGICDVLTFDLAILAPQHQLPRNPSQTMRDMTHHSSRRGGPPQLSGFSLIELLTVIAIMSVLMTVAAIGVGGATGGKGISNAVSTSEAIFDEARSIAVSKRTNARVLIAVKDASEMRGNVQARENHLRRMIIAYQDLDQDGRPTEAWTVSSRGVLLPEQTYFSREFSRQNHKEQSGEIQITTLGAPAKEDFRGNYYYYEFNPEGICTTPGASFVVGTGTMPPNQDQPRVTGAAKRDFGGFVIWRSGRTSVFRSPDQIGIPSTTTFF